MIELVVSNITSTPSPRVKRILVTWKTPCYAKTLLVETTFMYIVYILYIYTKVHNKAHNRVHNKVHNKVHIKVHNKVLNNVQQ